MFDDIADAFRLAGGQDRRLEPAEYLFHLGDPVTALHIVRKGEVHLIRHHQDGSAIVLQRARPGDVLAEASLFSDCYHCDAVVRIGTTVRSTPKRQVLQQLRSDPNFAAAWAEHLAHEIQHMRFRNEVLSLRTVASRLDAWSAWHGQLPPRGEWKQLANEIAVSAEALYREMAKRRD